MAKLMPEAELGTRPGDERLSPEQLLKISVFAGLQPTSLERYPGTLVLRRYQEGEVVCRQGEPGWTAFYILTSEDLLALCDTLTGNKDAEALRKRVESLSASARAGDELQKWNRSLALENSDAKRRRAKSSRSDDPSLANMLEQSADGDDMRTAATVSLRIPPRRATAAMGGSVRSRLMKRLFGVKAAPDAAHPKYIPIDGPVDLDFENPVAALNEGELFGEMSCLNRDPRSATVRATRECYMIEMLRNILEMLQKNKAFKNQMESVYRRRVLDSHLRALPIFKDIDEDTLADLRDSVELVSKEPGEVIFEEGDAADSLYVIRIGMVKVTQRGPGGDRVLAYRARGEYVGEIGLLRDAPRSATCTALDHPRGEGEKKRRVGRVELIRIAKQDLLNVLDRQPKLREKIMKTATARETAKTDLGRPLISLSTRFDNLGLMQGQKLMLIDLDRCTRCDECVRACADTHADGRTRLLREGPRFGRYLVPSSCRQCLDPVCMIGCPVGSIHKGESGQIVIEDWCIGCEICAKQCPYDAINMHDVASTSQVASAETGADSVEVTREAVVCDQCTSLSDGKPSCVYACPHDAAMRVDARSFFAERLGSGVFT